MKKEEGQCHMCLSCLFFLIKKVKTKTKNDTFLQSS